MKTETLNITPNTITPLKAHRLIEKTVTVEQGHLNVEVGEHIYILTAGQNITIPRGVPFAYANLSPSLTKISETVDAIAVNDDTKLYADETGATYIENAAPSTQISMSLYQGLADMRIHQDAA